MPKIKAEWPKLVKTGSVTVKVFHTPESGRDRYTVECYEGGLRKRFTRVDLKEAMREAKDTANRLDAGRGAALPLTGNDRDAYLLAVAKLRPLKLGLVAAIEEFVAAKKFGVPLTAAAQLYKKTHETKLPDKTVEDVYQEMLAAKRKDGASDAYLHDLKTRLGHFSRHFKVNISTVQTQDIDLWLRSLDLAPRSRNNHRNAVVGLFNFAKAGGYLDRDLSTVAEHTALAKDKGKGIAFFTPKEFAKLLTTDDEIILPMFVLGGFCGLRTEEILRLSWEDILWEESSIVISADVSKGGEARRRRIAPLTAPAAAWLAESKSKKGRVLPLKQPEHRVKAVCEAVGVTWRRNGLRHSFITYRVATEKDRVRVAYEAGNSPGIIQSNYDAVATEREGKLWFSITPETVADVIAKTA